MSHVWFNLVDSAGRPFKDSTADFVILTPPSNVAQLRKAIKLEYAEILPGITSAQLKVYRSNTDKEPLEEDLDISNIGKTKSDALYVCVPLKQPAGAFSDRLEMSAEECLSHMEQTFAIYKQYFMQQMNSASRTSNCFLNDSENRAPSNGQKKMVELEIPPRPFKTTSGPKKKPKLSLDSRLSNPKFTRTSSPTKSENDEKKSKLLKSLPEWVEEWKRGEVGTSYRHSRVIRFIREEFDNDYEAFLAEFGDKTLTFVDEWARDKFEENNQEWEAEAKQRQPALWYKLKANFPDLSWYRFKTKFLAEEKRLAVQ